MKSLRESLLNRPKVSELGKAVKDIRNLEISEFLREHYKIDINNCEFVEEGDIVVVNVDGDVMYGTGIMKPKKPAPSITGGLFKFGRVTGSFVFVGHENITSLEGAPEWVGKCFNCGFCKNIENLEGAPKYVGERFTCSYCENLKSLEGAVTTCLHFDCHGCEALTSLKGAPKKVTTFNCQYCTGLETLEGSPEIVEKEFNCSNCSNLKTLKGCPQKIGTEFVCRYCTSLESLEGNLKSVKEMTVSGAQIKNLIGMPHNCREIILQNCQYLTSLEGVSNKTTVMYNNCPVTGFANPKKYIKF